MLILLSILLGAPPLAVVPESPTATVGPRAGSPKVSELGPVPLRKLALDLISSEAICVKGRIDDKKSLDLCESHLREATESRDRYKAKCTATQLAPCSTATQVAEPAWWKIVAFTAASVSAGAGAGAAVLGASLPELLPPTRIGLVVGGIALSAAAVVVAVLVSP